VIPPPSRGELLGTLALVALAAVGFLLTLWIYTPAPQLVAAATH